MKKKAEKELIEGAAIKLSVTGPDNKVQDVATHTMSGKGMYHYAASFKAEAKGEYNVSAGVKIEGKDYNFNTSFDI